MDLPIQIFSTQKEVSLNFFQPNFNQTNLTIINAFSVFEWFLKNNHSFEIGTSFSLDIQELNIFEGEFIGQGQKP